MSYDLASIGALAQLTLILAAEQNPLPTSVACGISMQFPQESFADVNFTSRRAAVAICWNQNAMDIGRLQALFGTRIFHGLRLACTDRLSKRCVCRRHE